MCTFAQRAQRRVVRFCFMTINLMTMLLGGGLLAAMVIIAKLLWALQTWII